MSTRATYNFQSGNSDTTLYIHHDGYLEGAAIYFYNALIHPSQSGGAETMLRANLRAKITMSHAVHADAEYRYDVIGWGPDADLTATYRDAKPTWKVVYHSKLHEFIDSHKNLIADYSPFKYVSVGYGEQWHNAITAKRIMGPFSHLPRRQTYMESGLPYQSPDSHGFDASIMGHLQPWSKNANRDSADYKNMVKSYRQLAGAFPELAIPDFDAVYG